MTKRQLFWIICLISCLHALVHVFELALPAVQADLKSHYDTSDTIIGSLSSAFRWPWGLGALLVGLDRFGHHNAGALLGRMCCTVFISSTPAILFGMFFGSGLFASIYHPVGLLILKRLSNND